RAVADRLGLRDVRLIRPDSGDLFQMDPDGDLNTRDPDTCCTIRKTKPLELALQGFDAWITGRKRYQGGQRADLQFFEAEAGKLKINPLAHWTPKDVADYMENNRLP
ncbi:MAG: phosphoadenosine phosphosulfate reductase family protein, partial [Pseudomonadota bacterium]